MASTMMEVKVDRNDPALLHDQVAAQIRRAIADGEARPGDRLPPARHLAAVMQVNTNTVLRALRLLRDEGLLEGRPRGEYSPGGVYGTVRSGHGFPPATFPQGTPLRDGLGAR